MKAQKTTNSQKNSEQNVVILDVSQNLFSNMYHAIMITKPGSYSHKTHM
jgi:hypothetical protein